MSDQPTLKQQFGRAAGSGDLDAVRSLAKRHPELLTPSTLNYTLEDAATHNNVAMMSLLVEFGADVNAPDSTIDPEGCINTAANNGAVDAVRWLLEHGAKIHFTVDGQVRCFPLLGAAMFNHLDVVKLLVEHGADVNATWNDGNALYGAITRRNVAIIEYLRSKGAKTPWELRGEPMPGLDPTTDPLLAHITENLGPPEPSSLQEIAQGDPPITIHVVPMDGGKALVTTGMSSRAMIVPKGSEDYRFAELVLYLPEDWPLDDSALRNTKYNWPITWLRRIALYPHEQGTWLGGKAAVLAAEEPPRPLAPNTKLCCMLAISEASDFGYLQRGDGTQVVFYTLIPLYREERDLEKREGAVELLKRFDRRGIKTIVNVKRPNVAKR